MKVWIVIIPAGEGLGDEGIVWGVFSSREAAEAAVAATSYLDLAVRYEEWPIDAPEPVAA